MWVSFFTRDKNTNISSAGRELSFSCTIETTHHINYKIIGGYTSCWMTSKSRLLIFQVNIMTLDVSLQMDYYYIINVIPRICWKIAKTCNATDIVIPLNPTNRLDILLLISIWNCIGIPILQSINITRNAEKASKFVHQSKEPKQKWHL